MDTKASPSPETLPKTASKMKATTIPRTRLWLNPVALAVMTRIKDNPGIHATAAARSLPTRMTERQRASAVSACTRLYREKLVKRGKPYSAGGAGGGAKRIPLELTARGQKVLAQHAADMFGAEL